MSDQYQNGQRLRVSIEGTIIGIGRMIDAVYLTIGPDNQDADKTIQVRADAQGITVEHLAPTDWPPRPGDKWENGKGRELFATVDCGRVVLTDIYGEQADRDLDELLRRDAPWTLLHPSVERGEQ
ncbi:hypothetical protein AB0C10_16045 [Microbispora amethystogenes]|uniref:hypothetical protein n=1 Tax=Microbispora amethystogenes TaxID=1427754 RepID=UPI0033FE144F